MSEQFSVTILDLHSSHGPDWITKRVRKKYDSVNLQSNTRIQKAIKIYSPGPLDNWMYDRIIGHEGLRREVLARLACDPVAKHRLEDSDMIPNSWVAPMKIKFLGNFEDESAGSAGAQLILHNGDVEGRTGRKSSRMIRRKTGG